MSDEDGSSEDPTSAFYRGPAPFSEAETAAIKNFILGCEKPFKVFLSFHCFFELILFPWGCKKENPPNYIDLLEGGSVMAKAIFETSGSTFRVGTTKDLTYDACGTSTDWSYSEAKIPYSYMIELGSKKHKFKFPRDQIIKTCNEILNAVKSLIAFVDSRK